MLEFVAEYSMPYGIGRAYLRPATTDAPELVTALARVWVDVAKNNPTTVGTLRVAILRLAKHLGTQVGFDPSKHSLEDLRRRHIDSWESTLVEWQAARPTDNPYRVATAMFALLRFIEDHQPGTLHPEVYTRVLQPTRLRHIRGDPMPDFSDDELSRIKAAVRKLTWSDDGWAAVASADVLIAFEVALCIATGEPPEVIRALKLDDVVATSADPRSSGMNTEQMAAAHLADSYTVVLRKHRAHLVEEVTWTRKREPTTLRYLDALIALGAPLRRAAGLRGLWIMKNRSGSIQLAQWPRLSLSSWFDVHVEGAVSAPHDTRRFRKSAIAAEIIAEPERHLRLQRRHTEGVLFDHYTNSPALMLDAGQRFVRSVSDLHERALGPTIDTGVDVVELSPTTGEVASVDRAALPDTVGGALASCRDPEDSPHAPHGVVCPLARMGTCFTCPNAVITVEHLPAVILVNAVSAPDAAADPTTWQQVWGFIHRATAIILQLFPRDVVDDARLYTDDVLVDLGLRQELRGPTDA